MKNAETMLTGIASTGMSVERQSRRNRKMISATRPKAMSSVSCDLRDRAAHEAW